MKYVKLFLAISMLIVMSDSVTANWEIIKEGVEINHITDVEGTWFARQLTREGLVHKKYLVYTNNQGYTWDIIPDMTEVQYVTAYKNRIMVKAIYDDIYGYYLSEDKGQSWKRLNWHIRANGTLILGEGILLTDSSIFVTIYAAEGVESPVYRSTDNGDSFQPVNIDGGSNGYGTGKLCSYDGKIYAYIEKLGFYISSDNGVTWQQHNNGLTDVENVNTVTMRVNSTGVYLHYNYEVLKYNSGTWEPWVVETYYYSDYYDKYMKDGTPRNLLYCDYKEPYHFAIDGAYSGAIYYSIDQGKKWFKFTDDNLRSSFVSGLKVFGRYVYVGSSLDGWGRRDLNEAINQVSEFNRQKANEKLPASPEQLMQLANIIGANNLEELIEEYGLDADEITEEVLSEFLDDYVNDGSFAGLGDPFSSTQPGTCSYMGMPSWSINPANLKLFMRDVIFSYKGKGPEIKLALNYIHSTDTSTNMFGKLWRFEYESTLLQQDSSVILTTGTGASFVFTDGQPINTVSGDFTLPCLQNSRLKLHWQTSNWVVEKGNKNIFQTFIPKNDSVFLLSQISNNFSNTITIHHNAQHLIDRITDAAGRDYQFEYTGNLCSNIITPDNRNAGFEYNMDQLLVLTNDLNSVSTAYVYEALGNVSSVDIAGKTSTFSYAYSEDTLGMMEKVVDPEGRETEFFSVVVDSVTIITNVIYNDGSSKAYRLINGLVASMTNSNGDTKYISYNNENQIDTLTFYNGSFTVLSYDDNNNITEILNRNGQLTSYEYNSEGSILSEKNHLDETVYSHEYNSNNQVLSTTLDDGKKIAYTYSGEGFLTSITDPGNNTYIVKYDVFGNIRSLTNPLGDSVTISYDVTGLKPVSRSDFNGNLYLFDYDDNGRLLEVTLPNGGTQSIQYDCCIQTGKTDENHNSYSVVRDATNRILQINTAEGNSYDLQYDDNGFISGYSNKYGGYKKFNYNLKGFLTSIIDDEGRIDFDYNADGQKTAITDKKGNKTNFTYSNNKLTSVTDAAGNSTKLEYDEKQQLSTFVNARGNSLQMSYDEAGNVISKKLNGTPYNSFTYDVFGEVKSFTDSTGTTTINRNALGFVNEINFPNNLVMTYTYDKNGNLETMTYPNGITVTNQTNSVNQITGVSWETHSINFDLDLAGNLLEEERDNSTNTFYAYNAENAISSLFHLSSADTLANELITRENGKVTKIQYKPSAEITSYPESFELVNSNNLNQLVTSSNGDQFYYDEDGNLTKIVNSDTVKFSATYRHDNKVKSFSAGNERVELTYDAMSYLRKVVQNNSTSYLFYDHKGRLVFETDESFNVTRLYIYKGRRLMAMETSDGETYFYHYNRMGHTVGITDEAGNLVNAYVYSASGKILGKTENIDNHFTFLGAFGAVKFNDDFILTGARIYDCVYGRYIQRDPMGMLMGTNQYLYAANNPVMSIDPFGFDDTESTINSQDFDPSIDNSYGTAGSTANPFENDIPDRVDDWEIFKEGVTNTLKEFSDHPVADLLPSKIANPISHAKALQKLSEGDIGGAMYQYVPFNNTIDAVGKYAEEKNKYVDPTKTNGLGIFGDINYKESFSCEL